MKTYSYSAAPLATLAFAALLAQVAPAQTIIDNFTDPSNWGPTTNKGGGNFSVASGRMSYTCSSTNSSAAIIPRNAPLLPTTQDWSLKVDVHIDPFTLTSPRQYADVFLGFGKTGDWPNNYVIFEFDRGWWQSPNDYDIGDDVRIDGADAPGLFNVSGLSSPDAALRMEYVAATRTLTYLFDGDGAANGYSWVAQGTANLASGTYNMSLSPTDTFTVILAGSSEFQTVTDGQAYLSNLEITVNLAPGFLADKTIKATITNGSPTAVTLAFGNTTFAQTGSVDDGSGDYTYTRSGPDTGAIHMVKTAPSSVAGNISDVSLKFLSSTNGTFVSTFSEPGGYRGTNSGTFEIVNPVVTDFTYMTINGSVTIMGYIGSERAINIPSTINGWPVNRIAEYAFEYSDLTSVTIPNTVTLIGNSAFSGCDSLTSLTLGNSVISIGDSAFGYCSSLTNITFPNSLITIAGYAFSGCTSLTSIPLGTNLTTIGDAAFDSCTGLTSVTIPGSVTNIGDLAFSRCTNLTVIAVDAASTHYSSQDGVLLDKTRTTLVLFPGGKAGPYLIPNGVTNIASFAFFACANLTTITIPNTLMGIGFAAFMQCAGLTAIVADPANTRYSSLDGVLFDKTQTVLLQYPGGKAGGYAIPKSVTSIGDAAFAYCARLTNVTLPGSVTNIGIYAFAGCAMTDITIPNGVTRLGEGAFAFCGYLETLTLGTNLKSIGHTAFFDCIELKGAYFQGNAPTLDYMNFAESRGCTIYYLPGTSGWGPTFGGRPTALWKPQIQTPAATNASQTNQFGFNIAWASGKTVVVEASPRLANPIWLPVGTNTLTGASFYFCDPDWTNYPVRFYRLRSP